MRLPDPPTERAPAHPPAWWVTLPLWLGLMVAANLAFHRWPAWSVAIGVAVLLAMLRLARLAGMGPAELGLARKTWASGLRWGGVCAALVAIGYGVAFLIPAGRAMTETAGTWPAALTAAVVVIPLGTVIPEELAFRGVLWGLLRRERGRWTATLLSSIVFGFWHVAPALGGGSANEALDAVTGGGTLGVLVRVAGTVLFTAASGVLFCELRIRSGSLLTPMLAHWAVNGLGVFFVLLA